jgi:alkanesulfonate monooxygenase SsuD/methylene tetrahydromethanopterin reductase-like flavin-dependent oxidoreductase (luciferase family)
VKPEIGVYIPQVSATFDQLLERATTCERLGLDSFWLYDHLYAPGLPGHDALEAWTVATALLARTTNLRVGHLVLDNNFRHPVLLAKMASTLDVISNGRLDLGIGSGSVELEHHEGGFPWGPLSERTERLEEALEIMTRMFTGEPTTFEGRWYQVHDVPNLPAPAQRPPIHVGGVGPKYTLPLVARYADVWNVPTYGLGVWREREPALVAECERIGRDPGDVRRSLEAVMVIAADDASLAEARPRAEKRYAGPGWGLAEGGFVGTPPAIVDRIGAYMDQGVSLFVFFLADRGERDMTQLVAEEVLPHLR